MKPIPRQEIKKMFLAFCAHKFVFCTPKLIFCGHEFVFFAHKLAFCVLNLCFLSKKCQICGQKMLT